jgi:2-C-methyl-D-erythritol 4-phosphate cytidylyltransferase
VAHTLAALAQVPRLAATLVVLAPDDDQFERWCTWLQRTALLGAPAAAAPPVPPRWPQGLAELRTRGVRPHDWVLVHDAARCLLRRPGSTA